MSNLSINDGNNINNAKGVISNGDKVMFNGKAHNITAIQAVDREKGVYRVFFEGNGKKYTFLLKHGLNLKQAGVDQRGNQVFGTKLDAQVKKSETNGVLPAKQDVAVAKKAAPAYSNPIAQWLYEKTRGLDDLGKAAHANPKTALKVGLGGGILVAGAPITGVIGTAISGVFLGNDVKDEKASVGLSVAGAVPLVGVPGKLAAGFTHLITQTAQKIATVVAKETVTELSTKAVIELAENAAGTAIKKFLEETPIVKMSKDVIEKAVEAGTTAAKDAIKVAEDALEKVSKDFFVSIKNGLTTDNKVIDEVMGSASKKILGSLTSNADNSVVVLKKLNVLITQSDISLEQQLKMLAVVKHTISASSLDVAKKNSVISVFLKSINDVLSEMRKPADLQRILKDEYWNKLLAGTKDMDLKAMIKETERRLGL